MENIEGQTRELAPEDRGSARIGLAHGAAMSLPPLKSLHDVGSLISAKLAQFSKMTNQELIDSLQPGRAGALKVRPDGVIIDGHHRIKVLRDRAFYVDSLPPEIIPRETS